MIHSDMTHPDDPESVPILREEDIDCYGTDDVVCPWCGVSMDAIDFCTGGQAETHECDRCGRPYQVEPNYTTDYTTTRVQPKPVEPEPAPEPDLGTRSLMYSRDLNFAEHVALIRRQRPTASSDIIEALLRTAIEKRARLDPNGDLMRFVWLVLGED